MAAMPHIQRGLAALLAPKSTIVSQGFAFLRKFNNFVHYINNIIYYE